MTKEEYEQLKRDDEQKTIEEGLIEFRRARTLLHESHLKDCTECKGLLSVAHRIELLEAFVDEGIVSTLMAMAK